MLIWASSGFSPRPGISLQGKRSLAMESAEHFIPLTLAHYKEGPRVVFPSRYKLRRRKFESSQVEFFCFWRGQGFALWKQGFSFPFDTTKHKQTILGSKMHCHSSHRTAPGCAGHRTNPEHKGSEELISDWLAALPKCCFASQRQGRERSCYSMHTAAAIADGRVSDESQGLPLGSRIMPISRSFNPSLRVHHPSGSPLKPDCRDYLNTLSYTTNLLFINEARHLLGGFPRALLKPHFNCIGLGKSGGFTISQLC